MLNNKKNVSKTVQSPENHYTAVDSLRPFKLSNGRNYILAVLAPQQMPQTFHETFTLGMEEIGEEVSIPTIEHDISGGDVDHPSQYYQQMYIMLADGQHSGFFKSIIDAK